MDSGKRDEVGSGHRARIQVNLGKEAACHRLERACLGSGDTSNDEPQMRWRHLALRVVGDE